MKSGFPEELINEKHEVIVAERDPVESNECKETGVRWWLNLKDEHIWQRSHDGWLRKKRDPEPFEQSLYESLKQCSYGIEMNIRCIKENIRNIPTSDDHQESMIAGMQQCLGAIYATIRLHERKLKDDHPS